MSQEWYYSVEGSQQGPVSAVELKKLATDGKLKPEDLVWKDGMPEWKPASTIKGLFGGGGTSSATAPVVKPDSKAEAPAAKAEPARRPRDEDEEDERPSKSRRRDEDEDEDERPSKSRRRDEDEDRPRSRRNRDEDEDEDDQPRRRRDEDEDDEYDKPRKKKKGRVPEDTANKKMVAGLLAILIGSLGIHKFYLGMSGAGILMIVITVVSCGSIGGIIALIEGIIYLTKSDEDFYRDYIVNQKQWF